MLLLFDNAADAVGYAMEYHRALATLPTPLTARAGLHVGPVILRENAADDIARGAKPLEVEGLAKPIAARVMALARGGQTLLSAAAREDARQDARTSWSRTGTGGSRACPIRSSCSRSASRTPGSCSRPTATRRIASSGWATGGCRSTRSRTTCRYQATSFIGRERELDEVKRLLGDIAPADPARHGRAGQDPPVAADRGGADPRLSRRRLVPRPGADQRPGADRQRGGAGARRARRARSAAAADACART